MALKLVDMTFVLRDNGTRAIVSIESDGIVMDGIQVREVDWEEQKLLITYPLENTENKHIRRVAFYPTTKEKKAELEAYITKKYFELA